MLLWFLISYCLLCIEPLLSLFFFFFFNDTATTEIYTLSLHDALPISRRAQARPPPGPVHDAHPRARLEPDRKSTRLNSSHLVISYAVFCLKKKKKKKSSFVHIITKSSQPQLNKSTETKLLLQSSCHSA